MGLVCGPLNQRRLRVNRRGGFFEDPFFRDAWSDYSHAVKRIVDKFNDGLASSAQRWQESQYHSAYKTLRSARVNYSTHSAKMREAADTYKLVMDVREFIGGEITVRIAGGTLSVRGRMEERDDEEVRGGRGGSLYSLTKKSTTSKTLHRRFALPEDANPEEVESSLSRDAVLTVTIPKTVQCALTNMVRRCSKTFPNEDNKENLKLGLQTGVKRSRERPRDENEGRNGKSDDNKEGTFSYLKKIEIEGKRRKRENEDNETRSRREDKYEDVLEINIPVAMGSEEVFRPSSPEERGRRQPSSASATNQAEKKAGDIEYLNGVDPLRKCEDDCTFVDISGTREETSLAEDLREEMSPPRPSEGSGSIINENDYLGVYCSSKGVDEDGNLREPPLTPGGRDVPIEKRHSLLEEDMFKDCWSDFSSTLQDVLNRLQELSSELGIPKRDGPSNPQPGPEVNTRDGGNTNDAPSAARSDRGNIEVSEGSSGPAVKDYCQCPKTDEVGGKEGGSRNTVEPTLPQHGLGRGADEQKLVLTRNGHATNHGTPTAPSTNEAELTSRLCPVESTHDPVKKVNSSDNKCCDGSSELKNEVMKTASECVELDGKAVPVGGLKEVEGRSAPSLSPSSCEQSSGRSGPGRFSHDEVQRGFLEAVSVPNPERLSTLTPVPPSPLEDRLQRLSDLGGSVDEHSVFRNSEEDRPNGGKVNDVGEGGDGVELSAKESIPEIPSDDVMVSGRPMLPTASVPLDSAREVPFRSSRLRKPPDLRPARGHADAGRDATMGVLFSGRRNDSFAAEARTPRSASSTPSSTSVRRIRQLPLEKEKPLPPYVRQQSLPTKRHGGFAHVTSDNVRRLRDAWGTRQDSIPPSGHRKNPLESPSYRRHSDLPRSPFSSSHNPSARKDVEVSFTRKSSSTRSPSAPPAGRTNLNSELKCKNPVPSPSSPTAMGVPNLSCSSRRSSEEGAKLPSSVERDPGGSCEGRTSGVSRTPLTDKYFNRKPPSADDESERSSSAHQKIFKRLRQASLQPESEAISFKEEEERYKMVLDVEEYVPGEIEVLQDDRLLTVKGRIQTTDGGGYSVVKTFQRTFSIPRNCREEETDSALSRDGILTIFVPKKRERVIKIELVD